MYELYCYICLLVTFSLRIRCQSQWKMNLSIKTFHQSNHSMWKQTWLSVAKFSTIQIQTGWLVTITILHYTYIRVQMIVNCISFILCLFSIHYALFSMHSFYSIHVVPFVKFNAFIFIYLICASGSLIWFMLTKITQWIQSVVMISQLRMY